MRKKGLTLIIIGLLIIVGALVFKNYSNSAFPQNNPPLVYKDLIKVSNLNLNDSLHSPFTLSGEARGNWYFEASFPVKVIDQSGKVLFQGPAKALGDWMTTNYVPFKITLIFDPAGSTSGFVVLENDNPSGEPARQETFKIPVKF